MAKAFTATAISLLVDDDEQFPEVQWTTPVANLIGDDFVLSDSRTNQVTVEDILSHRSGLPPYVSSSQLRRLNIEISFINGTVATMHAMGLKQEYLIPLNQ